MKRTPLFIAGLFLVIISIFLARKLIGITSRNETVKQGGVPSLTLTAVTDYSAKVGHQIHIRFGLINEGDLPVRNLALKSEGLWHHFHISIVDVDGVYSRRGQDVWFRFGQSIKPNQKRDLQIIIVPKAAGSYRFSFQASDGDMLLEQMNSKIWIQIDVST